MPLTIQVSSIFMFLSMRTIIVVKSSYVVEPKAEILTGARNDVHIVVLPREYIIRLV